MSTVTVDGQEVKLFYHPKDRLRATINDKHSVLTVKPVWASPLTFPRQYLALLNGKGEEFVMLKRIEELDETSRAAAEEELSRRYLTATVHRILHAKAEFGATYWHVATDRGDRDFVTQSIQENVQWLSEGHVLLIDVDGNRFEILDTRTMDERSRMFIDQML